MNISSVHLSLCLVITSVVLSLRPALCDCFILNRMSPSCFRVFSLLTYLDWLFSLSCTHTTNMKPHSDHVPEHWSNKKSNLEHGLVYF